MHLVGEDHLERVVRADIAKARVVGICPLHNRAIDIVATTLISLGLSAGTRG